MPVEQREAGRWKRERQKSGTNTDGSAREGSPRWRDPCPMGMGGTGRLDGTHVGNLGNGDRSRKWFRLTAQCLLHHGCPVIVKPGACGSCAIFFSVKPTAARG